MLKLNLPFHLNECPREAFLKRGLTTLRRETTSVVVLDGLAVSIETENSIYHIVSECPPEPDGAGLYRGTMWPRCRLPFADGLAIEQQMLLPAGGGAAAVSWRLLGHASRPFRLRVSPIFSASQPLGRAGFEIEPETNGGRLAWRPVPHSSKIVADTNGRLLPSAGPAPAGMIPGSFEFELGPRPALLIFSAEPGHGDRVDPLIGGFLAHLAEERPNVRQYEPERPLIAA